jgi:uncharacterized protein
MTETYFEKISTELSLNARQVAATARLLAEGATVPFIARYRKEATGSLDEVAISSIRDRLLALAELDQRRQSILSSLEERKLLTDELKKAVLTAQTLASLEDIYQPYRPKRRTRAMMAAEKGLVPLADELMGGQATMNPMEAAARFVDPSKGVESAEAALAGARDVLAERVNDDAQARERVRGYYRAKAIIRSKVISGKEQEGAKFKDYFDWKEPLATVPSHRLLAMRRGEEEGFLMLRIHPAEEEVLSLIEPMFVQAPGKPAAEQVRLAVQDGYKRLLGPAIEVEMRLESKKKADAEAIRVFAENLRELLLAPPLGRKNILAIDPGFRTGCKIVCLDRQGKLLLHDVIFPTTGDFRAREAGEVIRTICAKLGIEAIAIGNGTAGRETEAFIRSLKLPASIQVVMVNESGASIYSASEAARDEFPDHDVTVRGAVSIGRRLMDPLAELVKLDPKSIGVGQYQHDVDQRALKNSLDDVVMSCVNGVGVELNTASKQLLSYVSGLGPALAANIVTHRNANGPFKSRRQLREVSRLGDKAFEQAAGFLRIRDAEHPLDASAVHPESYAVVDAMAADLKCSVAELIRNPGLREKIKPEKYVSEKVGLPTLKDILAELAKPGRDPRERFEAFAFKEGVEKPEDLRPGMKLPGIVTNVTAFGAFVDIGVHQDGLVHVSQLADRFVKDPAEVVRVQQRVNVTVVEVDLPRKRIALSMKANPEIGPAASRGGGQRQERSGSSTQRPAAPAKVDWFTEALNRSKKG